MKKPRVLFNLSLAHHLLGFTGIHQISRLLFAELTTSQSLDITGLLASPRLSWIGPSLKNNLEAQAIFLGPFLDRFTEQNHIVEKILRKIHPKIALIYRRAILQYRTHYDIEPVMSTLDKNVIWRNFFQMSAPAELRNKVIGTNFVISPLGLSRAYDGVLTSLPLTHLDTRGFDVTLFTDIAPIRLPSSTQKIMLYHDGLPVTASDTILNERHIRWHIRSTQQCATDSLFVCISPEARHGLELISPRAAQNAHIIPNILPRMQHVSTTRENLLSIAQLRLSSISTGTAQDIEGTWFKTDSPSGIPPYILSLATIEPRKNYLGLIKAWRRLCLLTGQEIKLMIVGSPGWLYQPILQEMQPFIQRGMLLHLEKVAQEELPYLYSGAQCFIFPSFGEGFGLPPCEAMQCGCPVLLSDIPAHRYIGADAALYFDPYDAADIAAKLKMILLDEHHDHLSEDLIKKGFNNIQRFSAEAVLPQWEALFRETASKQRKSK